MSIMEITNVFFFSIALLVIIYADTKKEQNQTTSIFLFRCLLIFAALAMCFFLGANLVNGRTGPGTMFFALRLNQFYLLCVVWNAYLFFLYIFANLLEHIFTQKRKLVCHLGAIPFLGFLLITVFTPFTGWLFSIDSNNFYQQGSLYFLSYWVSLLYIILAFGLVLYQLVKNPSYSMKKQCICYSRVMLLILIGNLIQLLHSDLIILWPFVCLALMVIYISTQKEKITDDPLTGLKNRGQLEKFLYEKMETSGKKYNWGLIMIDINDFKKINDTLGHGEGDRVLCHVSNLLKGICDKRNLFLARYGGDEFTIVFHCTRSFVLTDFLGRLERLFSPNQKSQEFPFPITISFGYSLFDPEKMKDPNQIISSADQKMYIHKKTKEAFDERSVLPAN